MRGLAERAAELAAEVCGREVRGAGERADVERFAVAGVDQILRAEQVPRGRHRFQQQRYAARWRTTVATCPV